MIVAWEICETLPTGRLTYIRSQMQRNNRTGKIQPPPAMTRHARFARDICPKINALLPNLLFDLVTNHTIEHFLILDDVNNQEDEILEPESAPYAMHGLYNLLQASPVMSPQWTRSGLSFRDLTHGLHDICPIDYANVWGIRREDDAFVETDAGCKLYGQYDSCYLPEGASQPEPAGPEVPFERVAPFLRSSTWQVTNPLSKLQSNNSMLLAGAHGRLCAVSDMALFCSNMSTEDGRAARKRVQLFLLSVPYLALRAEPLKMCMLDAD